MMLHVIILVSYLQTMVQQSYAQNGCETIICNITGTICNDCAAPLECQPSCGNPMGNRCSSDACNADCICDMGYLRNSNNECVPIGLCPTVGFGAWLQSSLQTIQEFLGSNDSSDD